MFVDVNVIEAHYVFDWLTFSKFFSRHHKISADRQKSADTLPSVIAFSHRLKPVARKGKPVPFVSVPPRRLLQPSSNARTCHFSFVYILITLVFIDLFLFFVGLYKY